MIKGLVASLFETYYESPVETRHLLDIHRLPVYDWFMIDLVDELKIDASEAEKISYDSELGLELGASSRLMVDRQGLLLAAIAVRLKRRNSLSPGPGLALYCILEILNHDESVAKLCSNPNFSLTKIFGGEIQPTRVLQQMPVAQAFWSALAVKAEGPVRVFYQSSFAEKIANEQAVLDLEQDLCDVAIVLSVHLEPEQIYGKVLGRK